MAKVWIVTGSTPRRPPQIDEYELVKFKPTIMRVRRNGVIETIRRRYDMIFFVKYLEMEAHYRSEMAKYLQATQTAFERAKRLSRAALRIDKHPAENPYAGQKIILD